MSQQVQLAKIEQSLQGRYYSCGLGVFIVVSFFIFVLFLLQIIKFAKRIYTHNIPNNQIKYLASKIQQKQERNPNHQAEINVDNKAEIDKSAIASKVSQMAGAIRTTQFSLAQRQETVEQIGKTQRIMKPPQQPSQQRFVRFIQKAIELIKQRLPILAICLVNTALLASYQFLLASLCIGVAIFILVEIMKRNQHQNIAWILQLVGHAITISWFINLFTVPMPL